jgi:hypothetical protein
MLERVELRLREVQVVIDRCKRWVGEDRLRDKRLNGLLYLSLLVAMGRWTWARVVTSDVVDRLVTELVGPKGVRLDHLSGGDRLPGSIEGDEPRSTPWVAEDGPGEGEDELERETVRATGVWDVRHWLDLEREGVRDQVTWMRWRSRLGVERGRLGRVTLPWVVRGGDGWRLAGLSGVSGRWLRVLGQSVWRLDKPILSGLEKREIRGSRVDEWARGYARGLVWRVVGWWVWFSVRDLSRLSPDSERLGGMWALPRGERDRETRSKLVGVFHGGWGTRILGGLGLVWLCASPLQRRDRVRTVWRLWRGLSWRVSREAVRGAKVHEARGRRVDGLVEAWLVMRLLRLSGYQMRA